jgi:hypothetical protein
MKRLLVVLFALSCIVVAQGMAEVVSVPLAQPQGQWQVGAALGYAPSQNGIDAMTGYGVMARYGLNGAVDLYGEIGNSSMPAISMTSATLGLNWQFLSAGTSFADTALQVAVGKELSRSVGSASSATPVFVSLQAGMTNGGWYPFAGVGYNSADSVTNYALDLGTRYTFAPDWLGRLEVNYNMNYSNSASNNYAISAEIAKVL